ncbi:MAG: ATP-binding protein [Verrucomicrobiota bacterium]
MEAVGRLAGGVAHDFNNILVVVNCYTQMLLEQPGLAPSHLEAVSEIQKAAKRATALTRQLLTFSRRNVSAPKVTDLNDTVQNMSGMLQRLIREDIVLDLKKAPKVYAVSVDESQIEQVIMNLVINAGDAMPKGGRVALSTSTTVLSQPLAYDGGEIEPNRYTVITVQDNGTGMTAEVRAKIYEPFFTTKPAGHGTGLGLATCLGIVQQCRGYILCESETGRGTTFRVYIPAVDKETGLMKSGRVAVASPRGHETILLVEDDAAVRQITGLMLRKLGYTVIEAGDGLHALALMQSKTTLGVDLVLTDAVMPNLNGRELIDRLVELRPELKFILMSGYTEDAEVLGGGPHVTFLQKPIAIDQLSRRVRETLDARPLAA